MLERLLNRFAGDFVEHHPPVARRVAANRLAQVPGDRLALAVEVGGQIDGVRRLRQPREFIHHLFLARQNLVFRAPTGVRIDTHALDQLRAGAGFLICSLLVHRQLAGARGLFGPGARISGLAAHGQVANVPDTGFDDKILAEIAVDGLRLGRRFDDHEGTRHGQSGPDKRGAVIRRAGNKCQIVT